MATASPTQYQEQRVGFADQIAPYAEKLLGTAEAYTDPELNPYQQYMGERVAQFTPLQQQSYENAALMQTAPQLGDATAMAGMAGLGALNTQYTFNPYQAQQFTGNNVQAYMSPYMQNVVEMQKREAARQSGIQGTQQQAQAAQAGAFGGGRDAIMRAERERNLGQQMGDIQAQGSQNAYQQAQQQFNAEQQARLQAGTANQQAGLTTGSQNLAANLGVQQLGTQTGLQTSLANLSNQQQAAVQNQAAQLQTQGMNAQQAMQAALANQQAGLTTQQQQEQSRQFGAGQGMQAASLGAQYGLAGQQESERSKQFGANLGLQGMQAGMQGYGALGSQGQNLYGQTTGSLQLQNAMGTQKQQQSQNLLDVNQQNFAAEQNYPYKQLGFFSDVVNRQPVGNLGSTVTQPGPSIISQGLGAAAAYYGAKPKAAGGAIRSRAGLVDLALSGM
jgi:hypothetical protein